MKFKTFQALLIAGGVLVAGGLLFLGFRAYNAPSDYPEARWPTPSTTPQTKAEAPGPAPRQTTESRLAAMLGQPANGGTKRKDLLGAGSVKINLYAEDGVWARAKIDRDRDERWDEKWRWDAGVTYRAIAPADDENYDPEQVYASAAPASAGPTPSQTAQADELRALDRTVLSLLQRPVQAKIKDASKGRPFKVNIYSDDGQRFNRAKVDLDRDDLWDEKWTFKPDGAVERQVSPADDEDYSELFVLEQGVRWVAVAQP